MEMYENEDVRIEIHGNTPTNNKIGVIKEWEDCLRGKELTKRYDRQRHIERVPPLLLKGERGRRNSEYYEPAVVSLGPFHHNRPELTQAEKYKLITLEEFRLSCGKTLGYLYNKVFEVVQDARMCYIDGSTDGFNDEEFTRMMLRDACFVLFFIECISRANNKVLLNNEYLGALGFANVTRDIFLLENQIPFVVLEVLLGLRFTEDKGENILNGFFNYLNYGEVIIRDENVLENKQPLHLLELYRSYFISLSTSLGLGSTRSTSWRIRGQDADESEDYNYVKRNRSFASVMELKGKGIFLKRTYNESSNEDIKFLSHCCYGELELVRRAVSSNSKAIYLNMIAYEMCAHNPNDFRISTYIRVMKSLVIQRDDVKELRNNNILLHSLGRDEEVVKMYDEIEAPAVNLYMFNQLRREIERHCNSKYKTWAAELITMYFSSPWKAVALFVASAILFTSFLQTYFAIKPLPDDSNGDIMKLLRQCVRLKAPTKPAVTVYIHLTPLLTEKGEIGDGESENWHTYPSVGRTGSVIPTASEVSVDEIRSAAAGSDRYPASLHAPLISSPEPPPYISEQAYPYEAGYGGQFGKTEHQPSRQILDEVEIRELLIDHVGHRCCWGSRPARTWKIHSIEDCNVYVGTLETFVEEREVITESEPYHGGNIDGKDKGPELGVWELDLRSEFPVLFTNHKESRAKIPHSETVEKCSDCAGRGDIVCVSCNPDQEPGVYKENQMTQCAACYGRGLIAHRDGSDTLCVKCNGKGKIPCATCGSCGLVKCSKCLGSGSLLTRKIAVVKWNTHATRKLNATSGAASVPDDVFHRAKGVQLCNTQAYQCTPAFFADSFFLNQFSSEVISERPLIPPTARVICERHTISVIPVTRVTMVNRSQAFSFYIVGFSREVYLKDYYPSRFCWGCCPCLDWLKL